MSDETKDDAMGEDQFAEVMGSVERPETVEELRTANVKGIDATLSAPWVVQKFIPAEAKRILRAQRVFWMQDDGTALAKLLTLLEQEP